MKKILFLLILGLLFSCEDKKPGGEDDDDLTEEERLNKIVNTLTEDLIHDKYFWADETEVKNKKTPTITLDPESFLKQIRYSGDSFSYIYEGNDDGEVADSDGYDDGFGYSLSFYQTKSGYIFAAVNYVFPNTPAANKELQRGDIIVELNGSDLTESNISELIYGKNIKLGLSYIDDQNVIHPVQRTVELSAKKTDINPILFTNIINHANKKIGYLHYTNFVYDKDDKSPIDNLTNTFEKFKSENIDYLILDLRYNPGGYLVAAIHIASLIAPNSVVSGEKTLIKKTFNAAYEKSYSDKYKIDYFDKDVPASARLGLDNIYIITGSNTASASEVIISGLDPYMTVETVGVETIGKYVGGQTYHPDEDEVKNWGLTLITFKYVNSKNESVQGGITPKHIVEENPAKMGELGDINETLLAETLKLITGVAPQTGRSATTSSPFKEIKLDKSTILLDTSK